MVARPPGARPVLERDRARGREAGPDARPSTACGRSPGACRIAARRLLFRQRPRAARRRAAAVRDRRRVPAARAPAGVGGHGRRRHPGLRRDRDVRGRRDDDERPPTRVRRLAAEAASRCGSSRTARSSSAARASFPGYWNDPEATARGVHRGRLVHVGRPRPATTSRAGSTSTGARRTSSSCPTGSTCSPRTSRTRCGSPGSATRWRSRRGPGGSRPSCWRPGRTRCRATRARRRRSRPPRPDEVRRRDRRRGQGGERDPGPEPADRRLARCGPRPTSRAPTRSR